MDVTEGHFHAVLPPNCHKYMKAPVTTHGLLLLAESKLSCTNVRNSDKRTQTISIVTMRINHGEPLPNHLGAHFGVGSYYKSSLIFNYSNWEENSGGGYRRRKERKIKAQRLNINAIN